MSCSYPLETNQGAVTSYVPLSTTFSSVLLCSNSFMLEGDRLVAFDPDLGVTIAPGVYCQPQQVTTWWEQALVAQNTAFSLGPMVCPQSWPTVMTYVKDSVSTQAMCCPPGYALENNTPGGPVNGDCISTVPSAATLMYESTGTDSNSWAMATTTLDSASTVGAIGVVGWNIDGLCASSSSSSSPTTSSTASPSSTAAGTSPSNTASATTSASPALLSSGLSTGAKAGIGIGIALGVIGLAALLGAIFIARRRKRNAAAAAHDSPPVSLHTDPANRLYRQRPTELHSYSMDKPQTKQYYQPMQQPVEMPPQELDAVGSPR